MVFVLESVKFYKSLASSMQVLFRKSNCIDVFCFRFTNFSQLWPSCDLCLTYAARQTIDFKSSD